VGDERRAGEVPVSVNRIRRVRDAAGCGLAVSPSEDPRRLAVDVELSSRAASDDGIVDDSIAAMLDETLATGEERLLRAHLIAESRLPGPRMNLEVVASFARAVGEVVRGDDPPVGGLEALLDGWAAVSPDVAPANGPEVILPCAAVAAYGEVGAVRPEWWGDEIAKIRRAAGDSRWRVREMAAQAVQRLLDADWPRTIDALRQWVDGDDALGLRAVAAAVAEPALLSDEARATSAVELQRLVVARYRAFSTERRRTESARTLRQALGFTISVTTAATGDFTLLEELAESGDADLRWIARQNLGKSRLNRWPDELERAGSLLA
jgi:hypothetical protein